MTVAAVIVTYNRKQLLMENLDCLMMQTYQVDSIIIIDNASTDGTENTLREKGYFERLSLDYIVMDHNSGGAGGFSYGVEYAHKKGFDFIILMDDDGKPYDCSTMENLCEKAKEIYLSKNKLLMLNSLVTYDGKNLSFGFGYIDEAIVKAQENNEVLMDSISPFNCTLVSKDLVDRIGVPRADFFISCDEREYNNRAKKHHAFIATVAKSVYLHPQARDTVVHVGEKYYELFPTPFKEYYYTRNRICIEKTMKNALLIFMERMYAITKLEDQKIKRYYYCIKAVCDAVLNRMGKRI